MKIVNAIAKRVHVNVGVAIKAEQITVKKLTNFWSKNFSRNFIFRQLLHGVIHTQILIRPNTR